MRLTIEYETQHGISALDLEVPDGRAAARRIVARGLIVGDGQGAFLAVPARRIVACRVGTRPSVAAEFEDLALD